MARVKVRGVSPERGRDSMMGKICEQAGLSSMFVIKSSLKIHRTLNVSLHYLVKYCHLFE